MARHKDRRVKETWGIKLTLIVGEDDDLIALHAGLSDGTQALSVKHLLRVALAVQRGSDQSGQVAEHDEIDVDDALSDLIG